MTQYCQPAASTVILQFDLWHFGWEIAQALIHCMQNASKTSWRLFQSRLQAQMTKINSILTDTELRPNTKAKLCSTRYQNRFLFTCNYQQNHYKHRSYRLLQMRHNVFVLRSQNKTHYVYPKTKFDQIFQQKRQRPPQSFARWQEEADWCPD